jgi:hypothetical protein
VSRAAHLELRTCTDSAPRDLKDGARRPEIEPLPSTRKPLHPRPPASRPRR